MVAADKRIDLARGRGRVQVLRIGFQRAAGLSFLLGLGGFAFRLRLLRLRHLADAMRNEVHNIQAGHTLLVQEINRVRILLAEYRHQHIGAGDFLLARGLDMQDRALDHPLKAQGRLRINLFPGEDRRVFGNKVREKLAQFIDVGGAGAQHFGRRRVVEQREQQMLHGDEFVALLAGLHKGHVQADF